MNKKIRMTALLSSMLLMFGFASSVYADPRDRGDDQPNHCPVWLCPPDDDPEKLK